MVLIIQIIKINSKRDEPNEGQTIRKKNRLLITDTRRVRVKWKNEKEYEEDDERWDETQQKEETNIKYML